MKATTYAALVIMLFFRNLDTEKVESIKQLTQLTDEAAIKLTGKEPTICFDTKYRAIQDLINEGIITSTKVEGVHQLSLSDNAKDYVTEFITILLE